MLSITYSRNRITIAGTSASSGHEDALRELAIDYFPDASREFEFRPGVLAGEAWESTSTRLLYLLGAMDSATATMQPGTVDVRGVTSEFDAFSSRAGFLRDTLASGATLSTDIVVVRSSATLDELCARAFANLDLEPVSFLESSAEIRQGSLATLDRITEFARDCHSVAIEISGHTDASGNENWNRQLSRARAQAVADRIIANGIDPSRLVVRGLGSSEPVADNATRRGRELNRRIEFAIR